MTPLESPVVEAVRGRVALSFLPYEIGLILHQVPAPLPTVAHHPSGGLPAIARAAAVSQMHKDSQAALMSRYTHQVSVSVSTRYISSGASSRSSRAGTSVSKFSLKFPEKSRSNAGCAMSPAQPHARIRAPCRLYPSATCTGRRLPGNPRRPYHRRRGGLSRRPADQNASLFAASLAPKEAT